MSPSALSTPLLSTVAFAARTNVGDPPFINNDAKLAEIPTRKYADAVRANITDVRTLAIPQPDQDPVI
jgi:hypothetical protein